MSKENVEMVRVAIDASLIDLASVCELLASELEPPGAA
jgi:hypothetical protein